MSPDAEEPAGEEARFGARGLCPHCGAICEPDQEYCLACGERLYEAEGVASLLDRLRYSLPSGERSWAWPLAIALAVAVVAASVAIFSGRGSGTNTLVEPGPQVHPTTASTDTLGARTITGPTTAQTTTNARPTTTAPNKSGLITWPGPADFTVVLASIPVSSGRSGAREKALDALKAGLGDVGVLKSSDYSSLHPGYYVVFSGIFESYTAALQHVSASRKAGFDSPYPKRVAS